jgi:acetyl/propionyl-CoA carboxylase alpha subunit/acetyl-CoA carboxylase carboxyltransferase component
MLKTGNSGGGKGIRIVNQQSEIRTKWEEIQAEVPDSMVYVTRYIAKASHFEIQVVGDGQRCIHLHGRDCSTQRRNQKLVEECPIQAPAELIARLENYAVKLMTAVGYRCLATVEFIYDKEAEEVFILEVNPRIQVEHIITEQLFDLNLVKIQFLLALNHKIDQIPELQSLSYRYTKHVISVRINSENPYEDFRPIQGKLEDMSLTFSKNSWGYFSMDKGGMITGTVDSQFGHILAWGADRVQSCFNLAHLIDRAKIKGSIYNTTSFLKNYIICDAFQANEHYTRYLHEISIESFINHRVPEGVIVMLTMIYLAILENAPREAACLDSIRRGHAYLLNQYNCSTESLVVYKNRLYPFMYVFGMKREKQVDQQVLLCYQGHWFKIMFAYVHEDIVLFLNNKMYKVQHGYRDDYSIEMIINQRKYNMIHKLKDATVKSPVGGKIIECIMETGSHILPGMEYVKIECMKMVLNFKAERAGKITYLKKQGDTVTLNEPLVIIETGNEDVNTVYQQDNSTGIVDLFQSLRVSPKEVDKCIQYNLSFNKQIPLTLPYIEEKINVKDYPQYFSDNYTSLNQKEDTHGLLAWQIMTSSGVFILLANNLATHHGTFSFKEDKFYHAVLHYARRNKLPFVFIASNSGADITINEKVKYLAKGHKTADGIAYLYLDPDDYAAVAPQVQVEYLPEVKHYRLMGICNDGIVNLDGSALLVAEMAKARTEIPTFTLVLERTVGVGAYLAKLSERIVQRRDSPIILTGYQALNKVLNQDLYESNLQLGGPQIMGLNGISHNIVDTTREGLTYIGYLLDLILCPIRPERPERPMCPERNLETIPENPLDAVFDRSTFIPTMTEYAKTVTTGRARIGGRAFGIIYNTPDPVDKMTPCDPANLETSTTYEKQSGNILYPDTSFKIAKTIRDVNVEGLPLLIITDWRGFSGGTRDMYTHVLDFGAMIISELVAFRKAVYIYVPDGGQLRGGSMVVFSKSINPLIKFCVSPTAHINVLEPNATKELKYRLKDVQRYATQHGVSLEDADQIATMYTDLNDVIYADYYVLNDKSKGRIIDQTCTLPELRAYILTGL